MQTRLNNRTLCPADTVRVTGGTEASGMLALHSQRGLRRRVSGAGLPLVSPHLLVFSWHKET